MSEYRDGCFGVTAPLALDTETPWGKVSGIHSANGERYYFLIASDGVVSYFPAPLVEPEAGKPEEFLSDNDW